MELCKKTVREIEQDDAHIAMDASAENMTFVKEKLAKDFIMPVKSNRVEECHKSLKSNVVLCGSPTHTVHTQANHVFTCLIAFIKLEEMKVNKKLNHFAMKAILYT